MQINLPDNLVPKALNQAAAAGFGDQIDAYVVHLLTSANDVPPHLNMAGKDAAEIQSMIEAGYESGPATPMTKEDWNQLREKVKS